MNKTKVLIENNQFGGTSFAPGVLEKAISEYQKNDGKNFGELIDTGGSFRYVIDLSNISHEVKNVRIEDGCVLGDIEILNTPNGKILNAFYENSKVYPRMVGTRTENGIEDLEILSFDLGV